MLSQGESAPRRIKSRCGAERRYLTVRVLIIGLGRIGMGYDLEDNTGNLVLTHARAFNSHPYFSLVGGCDASEENRKNFETTYKKTSFNTPEAALASLDPELVVIATPTETHKSLVQLVLNSSNADTILCEKPLAYDVDDAEAIVSACTAKKVNLLVNYHRRYLPESRKIKAILDQNSDETSWVKGVCWYSKGLLNNGSHFLNLLQWWLGPAKSVAVVHTGNRRSVEDPEPDVMLGFDRGRIFMLAAREEDYSHYAIDLVTSDGKLAYDSGGGKIHWHKRIPDPVYPGYNILDQQGEAIHTTADQAQLQVVSQIAAMRQGEAAEICTGEEALATLKTLKKVKELI